MDLRTHRAVTAACVHPLLMATHRHRLTSVFTACSTEPRVTSAIFFSYGHRPTRGCSTMSATVRVVMQGGGGGGGGGEPGAGAGRSHLADEMDRFHLPPVLRDFCPQLLCHANQPTHPLPSDGVQTSSCNGFEIPSGARGLGPLCSTTPSIPAPPLRLDTCSTGLGPVICCAHRHKSHSSRTHSRTCLSPRLKRTTLPAKSCQE